MLRGFRNLCDLIFLRGRGGEYAFIRQGEIVRVVDRALNLPEFEIRFLLLRLRLFFDRFFPCLLDRLDFN